jgi:hypothetical protein
MRELAFGFLDLAIYRSSGDVAMSACGIPCGRTLAGRRRSRASVQRGQRAVSGQAMRISGPLGSSTIVAMHFGTRPAMAAVTASRRDPEL